MRRQYGASRARNETLKRLLLLVASLLHSADAPRPYKDTRRSHSPTVVYQTFIFPTVDECAATRQRFFSI